MEGLGLQRQQRVSGRGPAEHLDIPQEFHGPGRDVRLVHCGGNCLFRLGQLAFNMPDFHAGARFERGTRLRAAATFPSAYAVSSSHTYLTTNSFSLTIARENVGRGKWIGWRNGKWNSSAEAVSAGIVGVINRGMSCT